MNHLSCRFRRLSIRLGASVAALSVLLPGIALAQEAMEEIVVTAQKREQKLQEVPGSISALDSQRLKEEGITSVPEIALRVPGVEFGQTYGAAFVTVRGVGVNVDTGVAEPNVAVYVDGLYMPRVTLQTLAPIDLQRVEVLRGPQGTLYGMNATGGAINFISQAPSYTASAQVQGAVGNYGTYGINGLITGPISSSVRGLLSAEYSRRAEGFQDNLTTGGTVDKDEAYGVRGALGIDLAETVTADLSVDYQKDNFQTTTNLIRPITPLAVFVLPAFATAIAPFEPYTTGDGSNPWSDRSTLITRGQVSWEVTPDINLKSISGYIDHSFRNRWDGDGTSVDFLFLPDRLQPSRSFSEELNLNGTLPNKGSWLVGLYAFHENATADIPIIVATGAPGVGIPPGTILENYLTERTTSLAAFTDETVGITDTLRIYGGARLSKEDKRSLQTAGAVIPGIPPALTLTCNNNEVNETFYSFSPRIGAQYDVAPGVMVYAQYSKGFKGGGLGTVCGNAYGPERLTSVEGGVKSRFLDGRLTLNASVFHYHYNGLQVIEANVVSATIVNADARTWGADIETSLQLSNIWHVDLSGTWLDAEFTNFHSLDSANPTAGIQDLKGDTTPNSPKYSINLGVQGDFPVTWGPFANLTLRADVHWSGKYYFQPFNMPAYEQPAYAKVNLNAILATPDDDLTIRAFARNVTNEAVLGHAAYSLGIYEGQWLPPRTFGLEVTKKF